MSLSSSPNHTPQLKEQAAALAALQADLEESEAAKVPF